MKYIFQLLLALFFIPAMAQNKDAIIGKWLNSTGEAHIDISKRGTKYYGKISWVKNPKNQQGIAIVDAKNPDPSLRSKSIVGLEILKDFVYEDGKWTDGSLYDPKSGKEYSGNITMKGNDVLHMRGYIGISIIGRTEIWKRVKS
jgi:uncharacterized protein (DUF2147 family)